MSKYNSKSVMVEGVKFDSKLEWEYYSRLLDLQRQGDITTIRIHPVYILQPKFEVGETKIRAIHYEADFEVTYHNGWVHIIDIKWIATAEAKLKRKIFLYQYQWVCLDWIVKYGWQRVDYWDNEARKRNNKKSKKVLQS
jgi:hypothetical protein